MASTWTLVELPGGVAGLRRLLGPSLDASRVFVEAARRIDSPHEDEAGGRRDLRAYMDAVDTLSRALSGFPARRASLSASRRPGPDAVPLDGLVDALGLTWRDKGGGPGVDLAASPKAADRRRVLSHAGLDVESIARSVNAGEAVQISLAIDRVPLPMPEAAWLRVAFDGNVRGGIARSVVTDRRALLLAHGLAAFDPAMLAWLTARPGLLRQVYRDHAGSFAVFGRSLRVEQGRVVPAGGERARTLWERMVGAQTSDPEGFALALLDRDEGRLAWLYDTVAHLDEPRAARLLGLAAGAATGLARMEALARVFSSVDRDIWKVEQRPFRRPYPDPALFLGEVALDPAGQPLPPVARAGWDVALGGSGALGGVAGPRAGTTAGPAADIPWIAERVFAAAARAARDRYEMVLFVQRVFGAASADASGDVAVAMEGFLTFPMLMLTLERMGLTAPDQYAAASRAAARISSVGDEVDRYRLLMQFQGALALVQRLRAAGTIDSETAGRLVSSLAGLRVDPRNQYAGGVARWMRTEMFATIGIPSTSADVEGALLAALSGSQAADGAPAARASSRPTVEWEGLSYVLDVAGADERALRAARAAQHGYSLDQVLKLAAVAEALISPAGPDVVRDQRAALTSFGEGLPPIRETAGVPSGMGIDPARILSKAVGELSRVHSAKDLAIARSAAPALTRLGDALLADTLSALAYAVGALGSDDPGLQTMSLVRRHDLAPQSEVDPERRRGPWRLPRPVPVLDVPWHIAGSLLALDFGLAESHLRRIEADTLPAPVVSDDSLRFVLAQHVILLDARRLADAERDAIVAAVARGRSRAGDLTSGREDLDAVARATGVSEWRRESIRWLAAASPASVPEAFSLGELLQLGLAGSADAGRLEAWGASEQPSTGALRGRLQAPRSWEALAGHRGTGMVAAGFMDLVIRVAQALSTARLPAALAPAVLAAATWDLCADVQLSSADDWPALVATARAIPDARFDDYVATLTGEGPLVPLRREASAAVP